MIIGIAERIVDLGVSELRICLPDGLDGLSILCPLVNKADRDAGSRNDRVASADREIFVDIAMFSFYRVGHYSHSFIN